ncbi:hypothetical protein ACQP3C_30150, partial [Escherichia coli]
AKWLASELQESPCLYCCIPNAEVLLSTFQSLELAIPDNLPPFQQLSIFVTVFPFNPKTSLVSVTNELIKDFVFKPEDIAFA